jgi:mannose-6-phosphate isomerase-like protein (cupin superfamily)
MLPQGELAQIRDDEEGMRYMAVMELRPGTVRGNHLHQQKIEHVYIIQGQVELWMREGEGGKVEHLVLEAGDLAVIHPGVAHALRVTRPGWGIEFAPGRFDPADVRRVVVIPPSPG